MPQTARAGGLRLDGHWWRQRWRHLLTLSVPWLLLLFLGIPLLWSELERAVREPALRARDGVREEAVQILTRALDLLRHDVVFLADLPPELISADTRADSVAARLFLSFSRSSGYYDQVRWIDEKGDERLRVNNRDGHVVLVPPEQLQNKADRPYFSEAVGLPDGSIYFSQLDLNVEHGIIERPLQPTLRVVSPVLDQGRNHGVVVLNYRAQRLLDRLRQLGARQGVKLFLVNHDGYWLLGPSAEDEWNWQLGNGERRLVASLPGLWQQMQNRSSGNWRGEGGDWSWIDLDRAEVLHSREGVQVDAHRFGLRVLVELPDGAVGTLGWRWKGVVAVLALFILGLAAFLILRLLRSMLAESSRRRELELANSALIEAGQDMQAMQAELARVERLSSLGLMIAGVAHEMNTPLGAPAWHSPLCRAVSMSSCDDSTPGCAVPILSVSSRTAGKLWPSPRPRPAARSGWCSVSSRSPWIEPACSDVVSTSRRQSSMLMCACATGTLNSRCNWRWICLLGC